MANIAGYRAIVERHMNLGASLPGKSLRPGKCHGKSDGDWCGCCRSGRHWRSNSLGAIVRAFDTRPEVKEQVKVWARNSSSWILKRKRVAAMLCQSDVGRVHQSGNGTLCRQAKEVDIIVTTALIPGKPAPS